MTDKTQRPMSHLAKAVLETAQELFRQDPDWVLFFREILGLEGAARRAFPEPDQWTRFEQSQEFFQVQLLLAKLRDRASSKPEFQESTQVVTVRLPRSLHDALRDEARNRKTSMNTLCITKLLQIIDESLSPTGS